LFCSFQRHGCVESSDGEMQRRRLERYPPICKRAATDLPTFVFDLRVRPNGLAFSCGAVHTRAHGEAHVRHPNESAASATTPC